MTEHHTADGPAKTVSTRWLNYGSLIVAQLTFVIVSSAFAWIFWRHEPGVSLVRYLGAAVTMWSALTGAYSFAVTQAHLVQAWFRGLSLTILAANVFLCIWLMASHSDPLHHAIVIHFVLSFNILRDGLGLNYFKPRSRTMYDKYRDRQSQGVKNWLLYALCAYAPILLKLYFPQFSLITNLGPDKIDQFLDSLTLIILVTELFEVLQNSVKGTSLSHAHEDVLSVEEGYRRWAVSYEAGNGVIAVERQLSRLHLDERKLSKQRVLDFGCGIGYYTSKLLAAGAYVIAVDSNDAMLEELKKRCPVDSNSYEIVNGGVAALSSIPAGSLDGIVACLVIDHLPAHELTSFLDLSFRILKNGGFLYLSDVNPYFEILTHRYAKFTDQDGIESRIRVQPHLIPDVYNAITAAGFARLRMFERAVDSEVTKKWIDLSEIEGFPLVIAYEAIKP